jgi:hypothetical protein
MPKKRMAFLCFLLMVALAVINIIAPQAYAETEGTDVHIAASIEAELPNSGRPSTIYNEVKNIANYRVIRANMSRIEISLVENELYVKARGVADPEDFFKFVTRPGKWSMVGLDRKEVFQFKRIKKVLVDNSDTVPSIVITLSKPAIGAAEGLQKGASIETCFIWDDEEIPFTLTVLDEKGLSLRMANAGLSREKIWQIRSALTLTPYPCPLRIIEFKYGDDLLRQLLGI